MRKAQEELKMTTNKPVNEYRIGAIKAAVFEKQVQGNDGKPFLSRSIALQIGYKNKEGEWVNKSISLFEKELEPVINVLNSVVGGIQK